MGLPVFNRVNQIHYSTRDLNKISIAPKLVSRLHQLQQITVSKKGKHAVTAAEVEAVQERVPPCRLASVDATHKDVNILLEKGSAFACCSQ